MESATTKQPRSQSLGDQLDGDEVDLPALAQEEPANTTVETRIRRRFGDKWKASGREFVEKIKTATNLPKRARKALTGDEQRRIRDVLQEELAKPQHVKLKDKLSFTLGVGSMLLTSHFLVQYPEHFWAWYIVLVFPLLIFRTYDYRKEGFQYFMFDFCYFVQLLCIFHILLFPHSNMMFEILFVCANGPLLFAIMAWRNSLVFHSIDKITSLFIHAFPPLVTWAQRWYGSFTQEKICYSVRKGAEQMSSVPIDTEYLHSLDRSGIGSNFDACEMTWMRTLGYPLAAYLCWQLSYLFKTEVQDKEVLKENKSIETSTRWFLRARKGSMYNIAVSVMRTLGCLRPDEHPDGDSALGKIAFMVSQFVYTFVTMIPVKFMYEHYYVHTISLLVIVIISIWNGATYYIEVFSQRYHTQIDKALERYNELLAMHKGNTVVQDKDSGSPADVVERSNTS